MNNLFYWIVVDLALFSELLVLFTGTWNYKKIDSDLKPFYFFFYYVVLEETFGLLLGMGYHFNTLWWTNIYHLTETLFFTWYFSSWIFGARKLGWFIITWLIFGSYWTWSTFLFHNPYELNAFARTIECLMVAGLAGILLMRLSRQGQSGLFRNPRFWIASGAMIYFSFSVVVYSIYQTIANNNYLISLFQPVWNVHSVMNILSNLLYSIAFACPSKAFSSLQRK